MKDVENVLDTANIAWEAEKERVENLHEEQLPFGYKSIVKSLDDIIYFISNKMTIAGYFQLATLRQEILTSKQFKDEE